jgi:hypothetical protein
MKIGINLVGISYNDGINGGRYRNYQDAIDGFMLNIVNPLKKEGHEIIFYIYSYDNIKKNDILEAYQPVKKYHFTEPSNIKMAGRDKLPNGFKMISSMYIGSLIELKDENLDLVISTRFDINFLKNPFKKYNYDFTKFNFLWREPHLTHIPLITDAFVVFPYSMLDNVIESIKELEFNPKDGINIAMHNWYAPMVNQVGKENVQWVCDEFPDSISNDVYKLMRSEEGQIIYNDGQKT